MTTNASPPVKWTQGVAVVVPCHRVTRHVAGVIAAIGPEVDAIYCVDDACPDGSGDAIAREVRDPRVRVLRHDQNQGVGGATLTHSRANSVRCVRPAVSVSITRRRLREILSVEFTIEALHQVPEKACDSELQATFKSIGESTVQVDIAGPNVQEVTAWGVGYDVNGTWECLWYSGILRSISIPKSVDINISSGIYHDRLIVHVETQNNQTRLSVTPSPEMP